MSKTERAVRKPSWCSQLTGHILAHQTCFGITFLTQSSMSGLSYEKMFIFYLHFSMQSISSEIIVLESLFTLYVGQESPDPSLVHHNAWTIASLFSKMQHYLTCESLDSSTRIFLAWMVAWKPVTAMSPWFAGLSRWQSDQSMDFVR